MTDFIHSGTTVALNEEVLEFVRSSDTEVAVREGLVAEHPRDEIAATRLGHRPRRRCENRSAIGARGRLRVAVLRQGSQRRPVRPFSQDRSIAAP